VQREYSRVEPVLFHCIEDVITIEASGFIQRCDDRYHIGVIFEHIRQLRDDLVRAGEVASFSVPLRIVDATSRVVKPWKRFQDMTQWSRTNTDHSGCLERHADQR
jgi:hypothetical protein